MKTRSKKITALLATGSCALMTALAPPANAPDSTAIQAIEQAPDPSAVVGAFANEVAVHNNDPKIYEAYVRRMSELGLPEITYHQAQTLTTMDPHYALAWAVVAHVDARRGLMPEAISSINMAGSLDPNDVFVQRTAGEILAWYDVRANKSSLPENLRNGLENLRKTVGNSSAYTASYNMASKAYTAQANPYQPQPQPAPGEPQTQPVPPSGYPVQPPYPVQSPSSENYLGPDPYYYADNYYDWGPGWVTPDPWWWWYPAGLWVGVNFFPHHAAFAFHDRDYYLHGGPGFVGSRGFTPNVEHFHESYGRGGYGGYHGYSHSGGVGGFHGGGGGFHGGGGGGHR